MNHVGKCGAISELPTVFPCTDTPSVAKIDTPVSFQLWIENKQTDVLPHTVDSTRDENRATQVAPQGIEAGSSVSHIKQPLLVGGMSLRWSKRNDIRICIQSVLVLASWLSGVFSFWSHFDGSGLWNDKYPHTLKSRRILIVLRSSALFQTAIWAFSVFVWFCKLQKWRTVACKSPTLTTRWFLVFVITDFYRVAVELAAALIFYLCYVDSVALRPAGRKLLGWIVDLMADGVVGFVPLACLVLPCLISIAFIATFSSVWEEFGRVQLFNRRFSLHYIYGKE